MGTSFSPDDYKGNYAMHCQTEDEANSFLEVLYNAGKEWRSGESYRELNFYEVYKDHTVYYFNNGQYGHDKAIMNGYTVLEWSDFFEDDEDGSEISDEEFNDMLSDLLYK